MIHIVLHLTLARSGVSVSSGRSKSRGKACVTDLITLEIIRFNCKERNITLVTVMPCWVLHSNPFVFKGFQSKITHITLITHILGT